jgi:hypothetical protein
MEDMTSEDMMSMMGTMMPFMMDKCMRTMKSEDINKCMHEIMPKMVRKCFSMMSLEDRAEAIKMFRNIFGDIEREMMQKK